MATSTPKPRNYGLLPKMIPFLDNHLVFLMFEGDDSLESKKIKYELMKDTNMVEMVCTLEKDAKQLAEAPKADKKRVEEADAKFQEASRRIRSLYEEENLAEHLRSDKAFNMNYLNKEHRVTEEMVNSLYDYGKFLYNCGIYDTAADMLVRFRVISSDKFESALWGELACQLMLEMLVLEGTWDQVMATIQKLIKHYDMNEALSDKTKLDGRAALLHWSLFPLFNHPASTTKLMESFFSPAYTNAIQTVCPWILRYLTVAVVAARQKHTNSTLLQRCFKDLVRIIRQESYEYSDPITDFIKALQIDYDFEEAQKQLALVEQIISEDYFLASSKDSFLDSARHLISETYCKIHQRIDMRDLTARLGLSGDEGEKWIVNLIRDTRMDAKINYQAGTVEMNHPPKSVYQQVIENTKFAFLRTQDLTDYVQRLESPKDPKEKEHHHNHHHNNNNNNHHNSHHNNHHHNYNNNSSSNNHHHQRHTATTNL